MLANLTFPIGGIGLSQGYNQPDFQYWYWNFLDFNTDIEIAWAIHVYCSESRYIAENSSK